MIARSTLILHSAIVLVLQLIAGTAVSAQPFYSNDFSGAVGSEWSATTTSVTPTGSRKFLGEFGNRTVALGLTGLPAHDTVDLKFDLFLIRTWDGNNSDFGVNGPDVFRVTVNGGPTLLNSTFSNVYYFGGFNQSFPNAAGAGNFAPFTGASEVNSLGYREPGNHPDDSVYHFDFLFSHTGSALDVAFTSLQSEAISNESWGLDNVVATVVPEPSAFVLSIFSLIGLGFPAAMRMATKYRDRRYGTVQAPVASPMSDDLASAVMPEMTG